MAELADALDLGSSGRPWGFKSSLPHQYRCSYGIYNSIRTFFYTLLFYTNSKVMYLWKYVLFESIKISRDSYKKRGHIFDRYTLSEICPLGFFYSLPYRERWLFANVRKSQIHDGIFQLGKASICFSAEFADLILKTLHIKNRNGRNFTSVGISCYKVVVHSLAPP